MLNRWFDFECYLGTFWSTVWSNLKITVLSTDKWNTLTVINISYKYTYM